ncbi:MAG: ABC-F family ATP-binding cassette domain-containing protein [Acidimicrobiales bacterium]|nr:ABC-F family ATP-binding cassette domain-containing protein [Acidimicrobiales bacterium]
MHVLSASGLTHGHEGRTLFADLAFGLSDDDRVAVVGPNGSGKSTLLRIVAGEIVPGAGEVVTRTGARIGHLAQTPTLPAGTSALAVVRAAPGAADHEAAALLDRLGIPPDADVATLSGGQQRRVSLARTLVEPADLLILDEPTNHLDADTIDWLEGELGRRACGLLFVTHDRYLLERLTTRMLDLHDTPTWVEGSYADVLEARLARQEHRAKAEQTRRNLLRKELAWLRRGPKARTSKPKFRLEQARALMESTEVGEAPQLDLGTGRRRLGTQVLEAEDVTVRYGDQTVLDGVDLHLGPGDRIGVVGPNGAGKTTLLRVLAGQHDPDAGTVAWGPTVELGVYDQQAMVAPRDVTVIDTITAIAEWIPLATGERLSASALAERFGFAGPLQRASVARLSGGERRRLALLHMLVAAPNVLLLDEPTNDLDIDTLQRLEDHLDGFRGTLVVASHDRFVLDRLTDELVAVEDGRLVRYLDWPAYRDAHAERRAAPPPRPGRSSGSAGDNRRRQQQRRQVRALEQRIGKLTEQRDALHVALARVGDDYERAAELDRALRVLAGELERAEEAWLEATVD